MLSANTGRGFLLSWIVFVLLVSSCGYDDDTAESGGGGAGSGTSGAGTGGEAGGVPEDTVVLSGVVRRSAELAEGGDGTGTLCLTIVDSCPTPDSLPPSTVVDWLSVEDANLSAAGASVPFSFEIDPADLPSGTYTLFGVLRESGEDCSGNPAVGDLASALLLGGTPCPEFTVTGPGEITELELYLNTIVM